MKRYRGRAWRGYLQGILYFCLVLVVLCAANAAAEAWTAPPAMTSPQPVVAEPIKVETPVVLPVETPEVEAQEPEPAYTEGDLEVLALVIYQEAGGDACSDETRRMVGTVVLNRVADPRFPDTIAEVATQYRQYGRLYWTGLEWPERAAEEVEAHAVARAYETAEQLLNGDRALPSDVIYQAEFIQGTEIVAHQDGIYFCR